MSNIQAEVEASTNSFEQAFLTLDPRKAAPFFNIPMIFISDVGVHSFDDEPSLADFLKLYMTAIKDRGYGHVDLIVKSVTVLNNSHAAANFEVERKNSAGDRLPSLDGTLAYVRDGEDWKIVVVSLLDHSGHDPIRHGSQQTLSLEFMEAL